jgi:hypothetical protein
MRGPSAEVLLEAWEQGFGQSPAERGLTLLSAAFPEAPSQDLARISVGRRDAELLSLREQVFGERMETLATCPSCGERLELSLSARELRAANGPEPNLGGTSGDELSLDVGEYGVLFRLPNTCDLIAVAPMREPDAARSALLDRCVLSVRRLGEPTRPEDLPADVVDSVCSRMSEADPQADVRLEIACPACSHHWEAAFDILSFLWRELGAWAVRTLHEIHTLASAYGWSQQDILALSGARRRAYLELAGA